MYVIKMLQGIVLPFDIFDCFIIHNTFNHVKKYDYIKEQTSPGICPIETHVPLLE